MPDSTLSKLLSIRTKIRRLTKTPSESQLATSELDSYINNFILYDMPSEVTLNSLKTILKFFTQPYIDKYTTNTTDSTNPLYNFKNKYNLSSGTIFISGNLAYLTQSRSDFYDIYPRTTTLTNIGTGDNVTTNFSGTLTNIPVLRNEVSFISINSSNVGLRISDDGDGVLSGDGTGTINYVTGAYNFTFTSAPYTGQIVYAQVYSYTPTKPSTILFFDDSFWVRPVPDKCYPVEIEVYQRPTELIDAADLPDLSQWWQYIALGTARKILIDRLDFDTANLLASEMEAQRENILYRTIIQNSIKDGYGI